MTLRHALAAGLTLTTLLAVLPVQAIALTATLAATATPLPAADLARAKGLQAGLQAIAGRTEHLWPGYQLARIPLVFHERGRIAYLFHFPGALPPGFTPIPGLTGVAVATNGPAFASGINTAAKVGTLKGVSVELRPGTANGISLTTAVHEAFHHYQALRHNFFSGGSTAMRKVESARDLALAEFEQALLADALLATDGPLRQGLVRQFLAVRQERHNALGKTSTASEDTLEAVEGTARYVDNQAKALVATLTVPVAVDQFAQPLTTWIDKIVTFLRQPLTPDAYARRRYYETGSAIGLLLDRLQPAWQADAEQGRRLTDVLANACGYALAQQSKILKEVLGQYDLAAATLRHQAVFDERVAAQRQAVERFWQSDGCKIDVTIPLERADGLSFNAVNDVPIDDNTLLLGPGSLASIEAKDLSLSVRDELYSGQVGDGGMHIIFLADPTGLTLTVDGRPVAGSPGVYQGALTLKSAKGTLTATGAVVTVSARSVTITF
jgi:hypothetical protein